MIIFFLLIVVINSRLKTLLKIIYDDINLFVLRDTKTDKIVLIL